MADAHRTSSPELDRNLAFLAYGLMFFAVFFAGAPALIAVAIAHARRHTAIPLVRRHHAFQIFVFWIGFGLALLASASGMAALVLFVAQLADAAANTSKLPAVDAFITTLGQSHMLPTFIASALIMTIVTALWLVGASAYGFFRLASGKPIVQTREP